MDRNQLICKEIGEKIMNWRHDPGSERLQEECPRGIWRDQDGNGICHFDSFRPTEKIEQAEEIMNKFIKKYQLTSNDARTQKDPLSICLKILEWHSKLSI